MHPSLSWEVPALWPLLVCGLSTVRPMIPVGKLRPGKAQRELGFDSWTRGAQACPGALGALALAWPQHGAAEMDRQQARLETVGLSEMDEAPHCVGGETEARGLCVSGRARARLQARLLSLITVHLLAASN